MSNFPVPGIKQSAEREAISWLSDQGLRIFVDYLIVHKDDRTADYWFNDGQTAMHFKLIFVV